MNEYAKNIFCMVYFASLLCIGLLCTGCTSTQSSGIESLVESRIIAERDRIRGEFAAELSQWITEDIRLAAERIDTLTDGQAILRKSVEEYRRFCNEIIERLQRVESEGRKKDQVVMDRRTHRAVFHGEQHSEHDSVGERD